MTSKSSEIDIQTALLQDILIVGLGVIGTKQSDIRKILGVGIARVNRIMKCINNAKKRSKLGK